MVTPEMLLFLAERMGYEAKADDNWCFIADGYLAGEPVYSEFNPARFDAQFGRLVVWAAINRAMLDIWPDSVQAAVSCKMGSHTVPHDSTPDSIRAAAVVAICRAIGYVGERE